MYLLRSSTAYGSGLTITPTEMVSTPSSPETIEPLKKQVPGKLVKPSTL
ncbi:MAG: hypothetical protein RQ885_00820 [Desulfurococcales archaeon]|nr:hypothetical protein [Desulfurococcales archaeon]